MELRIGEFYEVREGEIVTLYAYYDTATIMRQLGLLPATGSGADRAMTAVMAATVKARRAANRGRT